MFEQPSSDSTLDSDQQEQTQSRPTLPAAWTKVTLSSNGTKQVSPAWVAEHGQSVRLVDVRGPDEFFGPLHHVTGSEMVHLSVIASEACAWDKNSPVVVICRSAGRSDRAAMALQQMGLKNVASMTGGMLAWHSASLSSST
ncbi:MAG: rhodanese-related sulfurtransferase [Kiritimatiellia bacterium]|jgi:rhodanese-related sulfurtransferase